MTKIPCKEKTIVRFFDPSVLKKERELIDSWDYEICNQYGMDCLFVSQKVNFPKTRKNPIQNDLFFHAYGEISRPEYNEPFPTRVYVQFTEDLFAINGFGLNTDLNTTLVFNKTSFALDGAIAMADSQVINKRFNFKAEVDPSDKYAIINYKSKQLKFKAKFNWMEKTDGLIEGELFEFSIDPENIVKPDVLNAFKRRYSAKDFVEKHILYFSCNNDGINPLNGNIKLSGTCMANFTVKNPWKAYSEFLNRITPSVGDIVLLNGIDDNIIKLELTEVEAENKTAQGISPLLGSYSFKCTAKPYIASNDSSAMHNPITAPTDINAKKLIIQTVLNHDASKIADNVSTYKKLYVDEMGMDFTEDDIYGGYDLEPPIGLDNPPKVPIKHDDVINSNYRSYKWNTFANQNVVITTADGKIITYTPDNLYMYLKNLFDSNYTDYLLERWNRTDISVDYSVFDSLSASQKWHNCMALNVPLQFSTFLDGYIFKSEKDYKGDAIDISTVTAYIEPDRRLRQIKENPALLSSFMAANTQFLDFTNEAAYSGYANKYEIPLLDLQTSATYLDVITDVSDANPIDIPYDNVYELSSFKVLIVPPEEDEEGNEITSRIIDRYVQTPYIEKLDGWYNLRTDLYDIEQYNLGSEQFKDICKKTLPQYKKWKELVVKKMNGPLIPIYQFEESNKSRLATNGESLFFETRSGTDIYRSEISSFDNIDEIIPIHVDGEYSEKTLPLSSKLNWIEADENGIYFNNAYGKRIVLVGQKYDKNKKPIFNEDRLSHLNYENDIASPQNSFILAFKHSKYHLYIQPSKNHFILKLGHQ